MKTIGLIGGMSWVSSMEYYKIINETVNQRLGGLHSAKCILYSVDIAEVIELQNTKGWNEFTKLVIDIVNDLEKIGTDLILICTNTVHRIAEEVQANTKIPILHIADATAEKILEKGIKKVGLLGTELTMEEDFYKGRLKKKFGIDVITPDRSERINVHNMILRELCLGKITESSKEKFKGIIGNLVAKDAQGIVLGCTEIPLLIKQEDVEVPIFDTTTIHAKAAVDFALS